MLTHFKYSWLLLLVGIAAILSLVSLARSDAILIGNMVFRAGFVLLVGTLFTRYLINKDKNVDEQIFSHPVALAIYCGAVFIALAVSISTISAGLPG